jgi:poly(3-hydroxybutyrate) depolymerase
MGGTNAQGGAGTGGSTGGMNAQGGAGTGGSTGGMNAQGGAGTGGSMGGTNAQGGVGGGSVGGKSGSGGSPVVTIRPGNDPVPSAGCGKAQGITSGFKTISSGGQNREYIIDIPPNYSPTTPYRLFYVSHWINGNAQAMASNNYYAIKTQANAANKPAIFVAATGPNGSWGEVDHALFDNILAHVEQSLCIDTTRVFAIGYSFGAMYSYSLSLNHQDKLRAVVGIAPANYNIWMPQPTHSPIPWLQIHGLQDETCRWVNNESKKQGGKYIVLEKAVDNGCDIPAGNDFPVWQSGAHFCYEFQGCDEGYPVKICTNNGTHSMAEKYTDSGQSSSWVPPTAWEFFTRF